MDKGVSFRCCRFRGQIANTAERERASETKGRIRTSGQLPRFLDYRRLPSRRLRSSIYRREKDTGNRVTFMLQSARGRFPRSAADRLKFSTDTRDSVNCNRRERASVRVQAHGNGARNDRWPERIRFAFWLLRASRSSSFCPSGEEPS